MRNDAYDRELQIRSDPNGCMVVEFFDSLPDGSLSSADSRANRSIELLELMAESGLATRYFGRFEDLVDDVAKLTKIVDSPSLERRLESVVTKVGRQAEGVSQKRGNERRTFKGLKRSCDTGADENFEEAVA